MNDYLENWIQTLTDRQVGETPIDKLLRVDYTACELMRQHILFNPSTDQRQFAQLMMALFHKFASTPERAEICYNPTLIPDKELISSFAKDMTSRRVEVGDYPLYQHCIEYYIVLDIKEINNDKMAINTYVQTTVIRKKLREVMMPFASQPIFHESVPF
jgi:hypothetical protein